MTQYAPKPGLSEPEIDSVVASILREATLAEKVEMMSGHGFIAAYAKSGGVWGGDAYRAGGGLERLGVPALYFTDGPRGVARGNSTCFPVSMARGASFDRDLERRIGEVIGMEARAQGCNLSGSVCVNLLRHPGWGRAQETYGEDPYHVGEMGAALAEGIQAHNVAATVKHFALNSMENARFKVDVTVDARTLREVYLPHFQRIIDAGCATVMSAYNKVNGEYCGQNRDLLTDILRGEMGFDGFVHSDWLMGLYAPYAAAAGLDVENPEPIHYGKKLLDAVENGAIEPAVIDEACRRILTVTYRFACAEDPLPAYESDLVACPSHREIAAEAAEKSAVLLTNDGTLPLSRDAKIGVFGVLAEQENLGDFGSSRVRPPSVVTPLEGLRSSLNQLDLELAGDESDPDAAADAARSLDAAIVVVGLTSDDEGEFIPQDMGISKVSLPPEILQGLMDAVANGEVEANPEAAQDRGGDRRQLGLPAAQVRLIDAVAAANPSTIVVIVSGSAILMSEWVAKPAAVLQTFYSGMEGGHALARLVLGDVAPSGKLPFTVAEDASDYPYFDPDAEEITYDYWHGYTLFDREGRKPAFGFGHGLSYTSFEYRAFKTRLARNSIDVSVAVTNTGSVTAEEVVLLYAGAPGRVVEQPRKLLRGFERVSLAPQETKTVRMQIPLENLRYYDAAGKAWRLERGAYALWTGPSSDEAQLLKASVAI
ncbi:MAG: glycoside hydrolase family 3 C-terminal domain-containing protein [Pseudomonadota bacterium]